MRYFGFSGNFLKSVFVCMNPRCCRGRDEAGGLSAVDDDHSVLSLFQKVFFSNGVAEMHVVTRILARKTTAIFFEPHRSDLSLLLSIHW